MPDPTNQSEICHVTTRRERLVWLGLLIGLCLWAAWRMGAFDLMTTVSVDGQSIDVPNTFAFVDHPFHATRADTLLESLKRGEILRWVGNHQGGYPVEFYPLGIAWLDVGLWALLLGSLPIIAVHKLAVILVFLLPAVAFWILARGDDLHPGVAVLATAAHLAIPGHWLNGGYTELVGWGLVTNVAGGSLALVASAALARFVLRQDRGMGFAAILAAAAAAYTNPRSLFALVIAALAILIAAVVTERPRWREAAVRVGLVGGLALLLAAPVVFALVRYQQYYFFLHYEDYEPVDEFWTAIKTAVTPLIAFLAIGGAILPWLRSRMTVTRAMSLALAGYSLFTIWVATSSWTPPLVEQLEAPRLMPFQRQLMIYLGAVLVGYLIQTLTDRIPGWTRVVSRGAAVGALAIIVLISFVRPLDVVPEQYRGTVPQGFVPEMVQGLGPVGTTGSADFVTFTDAVSSGDAVRPAGTSMFIIGNRADWWHEQLWAPTETDAPLYYDDWLWYWRTTFRGPYDYHNGHYFPNPAQALTPEIFAANGISVVIVTDMGEAPENPREAARSNPALEFQRTIGAWDVYRVRQATSLVTNGGVRPTNVDMANERITAHFDDGDGQIVIRRNWFPRWEATVNGERVEVRQRDDGYMELAAPAGAVDVELRYRVTALDWAGRAAAMLGVMGTMAFIVLGGRWTWRRVAPVAGDGE